MACADEVRLCNPFISALHANQEERRDAYATLGSATCLTPWPPAVHVLHHSTKLLSLTPNLVHFLNNPRRTPWRHFAQRP